MDKLETDTGEANKVHQLVYTSAQSQDSSGLQVVGRPGERDDGLEEGFGKHWSYTLPAKIAQRTGDPFGERYVLKKQISAERPGPVTAGGPSKEFLTFSRITFSRNVHLGRTTPLAHHLYIARDRNNPAGIGFSDLVENALGHCSDQGRVFLDLWRGESDKLKPLRLERPRDSWPRLLPLEGLLPEHPSREMFCRGAVVVARLLFERETRRAANETRIVVVLPFPWQPLVPAFMLSVLEMSPLAVQENLAIVTQVWDYENPFSQFNLFFTYAGSPFIDHIGSQLSNNKYLLVNLCGRDPETPWCDEGTRRILDPEADTLSWVLLTEIRGNLQIGNMAVAKWFDGADPALERPDEVLALLEALRCHLSRVREEGAIGRILKVQVLAQAVGTPTAHGDVQKPVAKFLEKKLERIFSHCIGVLESQNRWRSMLQLWDHEELPPTCVQKITGILEENLDAVIASHPEDFANLAMGRRAELAAGIIARQHRHIPLVMDVIDGLACGTNQPRMDLAALWLSEGKLSLPTVLERVEASLLDLARNRFSKSILIFYLKNLKAIRPDSGREHPGLGGDFTSAAIDLAYRENWAHRPAFDDLVEKNIGYLASKHSLALASASLRPFGVCLILALQSVPESWEVLVGSLNQVFNKETDWEVAVHTHWLSLGERFVRLNFSEVKKQIVSGAPARCFSTELVSLQISDGSGQGPYDPE
jgi:hypothetical protein